MVASKFNEAKTEIRRIFKENPSDIFKQVEISNLLDTYREPWSLPKSLTGPSFAKRLVESKIIREHVFPFPARKEKRYAKLKVPMLEVLQSIKANSYFTHAFAMHTHKISKQIINEVYLNFEQPLHQRNGILEQKNIDLAFRAKPRCTQNIVECENYRLIMLNGMFTGMLGVETRTTNPGFSDAASVRVTDLERTLIDITVRPQYSGGVQNVLDAFILARDCIDIDKLSRYLSELNYVYPYHQALGWYLSQSGYTDDQLACFRQRPRNHRFYLTHQIKKPVLDEHWNVFCPDFLK